jgi:hypothetical protein
MRKLLIGLLYVNGEPSLMRHLVLGAFVAFLLGTVADIVIELNGHIWGQYQTFATITGGGSLGAKIVDTAVNGIACSSPGQSFIKNNGS